MRGANVVSPGQLNVNDHERVIRMYSEGFGSRARSDSRWYLRLIPILDPLVLLTAVSVGVECLGRGAGHMHVRRDILPRTWHQA